MRYATTLGALALTIASSIALAMPANADHDRSWCNDWGHDHHQWRGRGYHYGWGNNRYWMGNPWRNDFRTNVYYNPRYYRDYDWWR